MRYAAMNESVMQEIDGTEHLRPGEFWTLKLYVAGQSPRSLAAFANLQRLYTEHLLGKYMIEVIDLLEHPQARGRRPDRSRSRL